LIARLIEDAEHAGKALNLTHFAEMPWISQQYCVAAHRRAPEGKRRFSYIATRENGAAGED
jgi:hypothetical protein